MCRGRLDLNTAGQLASRNRIEDSKIDKQAHRIVKFLVIAGSLFTIYLKRWGLKSPLNQWGSRIDDGLCDEGGLYGPWIKQVGVITHFPQLHQDVDHRHEMAFG